MAEKGAGLEQHGHIGAVIQARFVQQIKGIILVTPTALAQMIPQGEDVGDFGWALFRAGFLHSEFDRRMTQMKQNLSAPLQSLQFGIQRRPLKRQMVCGVHAAGRER